MCHHKATLLLIVPMLVLTQPHLVIVNFLDIRLTFVSDSDERAVTLEISRKLGSRQIPAIEEPDVSDVKFTLTTDMQRNGDFNVALKITNASSSSRTVDVHMSAISCRYTGISNAELKDTCTTDILEPNAGEQAFAYYFLHTPSY